MRNAGRRPKQSVREERSGSRRTAIGARRHAAPFFFFFFITLEPRVE